MHGGPSFTPTSATGPANVQTTVYLYVAALLSAVGGFLFGYDTGVVSGALLQLRDHFKLDLVWQEWVVAITIAGAWLFAILAGKLNDLLGRKFIVIIASSLFTLGSGLMAGAQSRWWLLSGRLIVGFGVGLSSMTVPLYIAEVSPMQYRGKLVTINQLFITAGQFCAAVVDGIFSTDPDNGWRFMLGLAAVPAVFQFTGFLWMPESPRWLAGKGRNDEAYTVLRKLRGKNADIEDEFNAIKASGKEVNAEKSCAIIEVLADPFLRKRLLVGVMFMVFQQIIAINTVMYYSASIIEMAGFRDQSQAIWLSAGVAFINFAFTIVGVLLVERVGRRTLTLSSLLGVIFSLGVLSAAFYAGNINSPAVTFNVSDSSPCDVYETCGTCIADSLCAFYHNADSLKAACVLRHVNETAQHPVDWIKETSMCPVPNHLGWITLTGLGLYLVFFAPGMGPMPWTVNSELYPLWCRSTCFSIATSFNWLFNFLVAMTFLSLTEALTQQGAFLLYAVCAVAGFIFFYFMQPETKNTSLEDVKARSNQAVTISRH
ncbi:proton myo-inositol cotransporter [Galendromus occidentalis]|uniref:Proton myo-inositol cotransporter n=1 Tax=Galendromus occidentalis TaxID=34638 RepID=A0AAJ6QM40_9ACAR|nr:proton myo-inositol cotransporter [Galendromus occidentalis]